MSILLLAAWLGASLLTSAVVAPAAFDVLPTRTMAGALVGRVLPVLFVGGAIVGALVALLGRRERGARRGHGIVTSAAIVLVVGCLVAQLGITPRIERLRAEAGVPVDALPRTDARRVAFGRLHGASVLALGVSMLAGAVAVAAGLRAIVTTGGQPGKDGEA